MHEKFSNQRNVGHFQEEKKVSLVALKVWAIPLSKERIHLTHTLYAKGACGEREERGTPGFERARFRQRQQEVKREETHTQTIECCCGGLEKKNKMRKTLLGRKREDDEIENLYLNQC